jgi:hypothetical protein
MQGEHKRPSGEHELDPRYEAELKSQLPWLHNSDSLHLLCHNRHNLLLLLSIHICLLVTTFELKALQILRQMSSDWDLDCLPLITMGLVVLSLDGFSTYLFPLVTESPTLARRLGSGLTRRGAGLPAP